MARAITKKAKDISVYQQSHDAFTKDFIFNHLAASGYSARRHPKKTSLKTSDGINLYETAELRHSSNGIKLHPEFLAFYLGLKEGCAKKLLLYILFHVVKLHSCKFPFNDHIIKEFNDYCRRVTGKPEYKNDVVKQAIRDLVDANLCLSVKRQEYMINPLIVSVNQREQWSLINTYTKELLNKGKEIDANFFPKYFAAP